MKKLIVFAALIMAVVCAQAQQVAYTINGVSSNNGAKVALFDMQAGKLLTTAEVVNGKFSLTGNAEKDLMMAIQLENNNWITSVINDGTPMTVNLNDSTLKGSAQNERMVNYDLKMNANFNEEKAAPILEEIFTKEANTMIPMAFVGQYLQVFGLDKMKELLAAKPVWGNNAMVKSLVEQFEYYKAEEAKKAVYIGKTFTDLEEADPDGQLHKLSEYVGKGKWVLVDFWASWCGPCRAEMPNVVKAYEKYHDKGFDIVGLSFDNKKEPWVKAIETLQMPWVHLSDLKGWKTVAAGIYGVNSIPDNLLIDPQGKIVARGLRARGLHKKLQEIFGE